MLMGSTGGLLAQTIFDKDMQANKHTHSQTAASVEDTLVFKSGIAQKALPFCSPFPNVSL